MEQAPEILNTDPIENFTEVTASEEKAKADIQNNSIEVGALDEENHKEIEQKDEVLHVDNQIAPEIMKSFDSTVSPPKIATTDGSILQIKDSQRIDSVSPKQSNLETPVISPRDSQVSSKAVDKFNVTNTSLSIGTAQSKNVRSGSPSARKKVNSKSSTRQTNAKKTSTTKVKSPKSQVEIEESFRKIINTTIMSKPPGVHRASSSISIMPTNETDLQRTKKYLIRSHPLRGEEPGSWKNIPPCVTQAISHSITSIIAGEESLFDWQIKTNERLHKLQAQINVTKVDLPKIEKDLQLKIEDRSKIAENRSIKNTKLLENEYRSNKELQHQIDTKQQQFNTDVKSKLSKHHASIVEINAAHAKMSIEIEETIQPITVRLNQVYDMVKTTIDEKLTVWYMDEEGENKSKDLKEFIYDKFEDIEPKIKKKFITPLEKRLAAVDEAREEQDISNSTNFEKLKSKCEMLEEKISKMEKESIMNDQRFNQIERDFEESLSELRLKLSKAGNTIDSQDQDTSVKMSKGTHKKLEQELKLIKQESIPQAVKKLDNDIDIRIKENGNLVSAKLEKKIKDLKIQLKDSITNSNKDLIKKMKENNKAMKEQFSSFASLPAGQQSIQAIQETPEPTPTPPPVENDLPGEQEDDDKDNDEYIKLLIKDQLDERIKAVNEELEALQLETEKLWDRQPATIEPGEPGQSAEPQSAVSPPPGRNTGLSSRGGMNKKEKQELREELDDFSQKIDSLGTQFKILDMIVKENSKKRAEDDPHYEPFQNQKKNIDHNEKYNSAERAKKIQRPTSSAEGRNKLKKAIASQESLNNCSQNAKIIKDAESKYKNFAGVGNSNNAILNTAYKGQKTVQSHVLAAISSHNSDNRIHVSMPSMAGVSNAGSQHNNAHNTMTLFTFPETDNVTNKFTKADGIMRAPKFNIGGGMEKPSSTRNVNRPSASGQNSLGQSQEGFMTARVSNGGGATARQLGNNEKIRNSMALESGLPSLTANLTKKGKAQNQVKQAYGQTGTTKFEKIQGF